MAGRLHLVLACAVLTITLVPALPVVHASRDAVAAAGFAYFRNHLAADGCRGGGVAEVAVDLTAKEGLLLFEGAPCYMLPAHYRYPECTGTREGEVTCVDGWSRLHVAPDGTLSFVRHWGPGVVEETLEGRLVRAVTPAPS